MGIPHHQQAVNMCKALDIAKGTECDDIFNEDDPQCVLKVLCQEIINVQNAQIQTMRGVLASLDYKETDNCVVEIPVDPETACLAESDSTGYIWCTLTQTCVAPGDDACLKANCEKNSSSTGYKWCPETRTCDAPNSDACEIAACPGPWCAILRTCDPPGDACEKATCEQNSGSNGFSRCAATQTCVAPGDDSCLIANCEQDSGSTGYTWCTVTRTCDAPGSDACEKAECEKNTGSDGYKWCRLLQTCVSPSDTSCDQAECESTSGSTGYVWCTSVQQCIPFAECDPTPSPTSRPTKSSKRRRHYRTAESNREEKRMFRKKQQLLQHLPFFDTMRVTHTISVTVESKNLYIRNIFKLSCRFNQINIYVYLISIVEYRTIILILQSQIKIKKTKIKI